VVTHAPPSRVELLFALLALMLRPLLRLAERALARADARVAERLIDKAERELARSLREALITIGYRNGANLPDDVVLRGVYDDAPGSDNFPLSWQGEGMALGFLPLSFQGEGAGGEDHPSLRIVRPPFCFAVRRRPHPLPPLPSGDGDMRKRTPPPHAVEGEPRAPPNILENRTSRRAWLRQAAGASACLEHFQADRKQSAARNPLDLQ
jgi:hypothetical protein